jgi:hypothetical protein
MDIAVTGLAPLQLPGVDRGRQQRPQAEQQNNRSRNQSNQQASRDSAGREGRVIRGEVTSRSSVNPSRIVSSTQSALSERDASFGQSNTRQFSVPAAIQTFRDNEALIAPEGEQRQVSGIIDEFV